MTSVVSGAGAEADSTADFVVLGSGAAGLTGALAAAADGVHVVLLEKSSLIGGTTAMSGGVQWIPMNHHMGEVGVDDSRSEALAYLRACEGSKANDEILVALVDNAAPMVQFLEGLGVGPFRAWPSIGGTLDYRPWLEGAKPGGRGLDPGKFALSALGEWSSRLRVGTPWQLDMMDYYKEKMYHSPPPRAEDPDLPSPRSGQAPAGTEVEFVGSGTALVGRLFAACLEHNVVPYLDTQATALVIEDGRVVGVRAVHDGRSWLVRARHGVLVATGGYGGNEELKRLWLNRPLLATCEIVENEGDGHLMGMAAGAQLAGLGEAWWMPYAHIGVDYGVTNIGGTREDRILPHTMIVNKAGRRFINETTNYFDFGESFGSITGAGPRNFPAWLIFDQQGVDRYAMLAMKVPPGKTPEWLTVGRSMAHLAEILGIDADGLAETTKRFNRFATEGKDLDFHRGEGPWDLAWGDPDNGANSCLGTLEKPPFYAVELVPGALATKGGLRVNDRGQVISAGAPFDPIPGLYAAGNSSNAAPSASYPGPGATIGSAMTFGYIVGRQIAEMSAGHERAGARA
jgi:3-oxosteroid 1-dehydrogenase